MAALKTYSARKTAHEINWDQANVLTDFTSPWSENPQADLGFRALWNEEWFYFLFEVARGQPITYVNTNHKLEVAESDRVEIFLRSGSEMDPYYCLEMDPLGRVLDYKAIYYRQFDFTWRWPGRDHLLVTGQRFSKGYRVEGRISMKSLHNLGLLTANELQVGLFRGECLAPLNSSQFNWISWVNPQSEKPDFHIPSSFGVIRLISS